VNVVARDCNGSIESRGGLECPSQATVCDIVGAQETVQCASEDKVVDDSRCCQRTGRKIDFPEPVTVAGIDCCQLAYRSVERRRVVRGFCWCKHRWTLEDRSIHDIVRVCDLCLHAS